MQKALANCDFALKYMDQLIIKQHISFESKHLGEAYTCYNNEFKELEIMINVFTRKHHILEASLTRRH
jgi:hypothetical protein